MYPGSSGRGWGALSAQQKLIIAVVGLLLVYGLFSSGGGGPFGRLLDPRWLIATLTIILVALPVHEMAHAAMAVALGDNTPRLMGRYTLNPAAHIDPVGAVLILFTGFGWAKPVQWNPRNVDVDYRVASILVSLAGPVSNLIMAAIALLVMRLVPLPVAFLSTTLEFFVWINVLLFVFNLIPIPPLDGSHVLFALLPGDTYRLQAQLAQYGILLLFAVIYFLPAIVLVPSQLILSGLVTLLP